jgi:hypothetical protein
MEAMLNATAGWPISIPFSHDGWWLGWCLGWDIYSARTLGGGFQCELERILFRDSCSCTRTLVSCSFYTEKRSRGKSFIRASTLYWEYCHIWRVRRYLIHLVHYPPPLLLLPPQIIKENMATIAWTHTFSTLLRPDDWVSWRQPSIKLIKSYRR